MRFPLKIITIYSGKKNTIAKTIIGIVNWPIFDKILLVKSIAKF